MTSLTVPSVTAPGDRSSTPTSTTRAVPTDVRPHPTDPLLWQVLSADDLTRFWAKVNRSDRCWIWTGAKTRGGYGHMQVRINGQKRDIRAHRLAYMMAHGGIPDGLLVCHDCPDGDNPACVRIDHLFLGTHADNTRDCVTKQRHFSPYRDGTVRQWRRLRHAEILDIRTRVDDGMSVLSVAQSLGFSPATITKCANRETYSTVPEVTR